MATTIFPPVSYSIFLLLTFLSLRHFASLSSPVNYSLSLLPSTFSLRSTITFLSTLNHYPFCYSLCLPFNYSLSLLSSPFSLYAQPLILSLRSETTTTLSTPATTIPSRYSETRGSFMRGNFCSVTDSRLIHERDFL
ncbi:hypothetical protein AMTRI_Chr04g248130 [Amborella trichopoda]